MTQYVTKQNKTKSLRNQEFIWFVVHRVRSVVMEKAQQKEWKEVDHIASIIKTHRGMNAAIPFAFFFCSVWNPSPWDDDATFPNQSS